MMIVFFSIDLLARCLFLFYLLLDSGEISLSLSERPFANYYRDGKGRYMEVGVCTYFMNDWKGALAFLS